VSDLHPLFRWQQLLLVRGREQLIFSPYRIQAKTPEKNVPANFCSQPGLNLDFTLKNNQVEKNIINFKTLTLL